jgi:hypothetical protein
VATQTSVDLALHVVRTEAGIHGTLAVAQQPGEQFVGWLELTGAIARALEATMPKGGTR